ncbi:Retrovirus-related Pol polyprotein from transposon 17.6 [Merluccius polli]|uniref:ribonuclease H n=1 Tax=Merluccius polli TaxID=89951 RepID=A0AA47N438_MERPO|nr:Retrovirus-related Pol polyprotein from transposon 17.6 [Merluccius polli]
MEAGAAMASLAFSDGAVLGAEASAAAPMYSTDQIPVIQAGLETEDLKLTLRLREVELQTKTKECELMLLRIQAMEVQRSPGTSTHVSALPYAAPPERFDVSRQIRLVPQFREDDVDSYFKAFERITVTLGWPKEVWCLLLQCKLIGKAQEVCNSLSIEESLNYDIVKATVLRAYELVPEAYRQKFRGCEKAAKQTHVEFAREKTILFDKWLAACKVANFAQLCELLLVEEFKMCLPDKIVVYLNEQKVESMSKVLADEFVLTHRVIFPTGRREQPAFSNSVKNSRASPPRSPANLMSPGSPECYYCHETGHVISHCPVISRKEQSARNPKIPSLAPVGRNENKNDCVADSYRPFILKGLVSLTGKEEDQVPIIILRDTGATQSLLLDNVLPFSDKSSCGSDVLVWGVKMSILRVPLHNVFLRSPLVSGPVKIGICANFPARGVALILGNDLAGGKVFATPEVVETPVAEPSVAVPAAVNMSSVFPACAVTRTQTRKFDGVDLSDSFLCSENDSVENEMSCVKPGKCVPDNLLPSNASLSFEVDRTEFIQAQQADQTLVTCLSTATNPSAGNPCVYSVNDGMLMRKWYPPSDGALECFHQTLKAMMRKFCLESGKEWDEGLPFLLLTARESVQESTGFSPAELVFGHTVRGLRGPLRLLKGKKYLSDVASPSQNVLDYVSSFRERLHKACEAARSALSVSLNKMKKRYDKKRCGEISKLAKLCGPYEIKTKLSDTDYVVRTPDRRRKSCVCHINMIKPYFARGGAVVSSSPAVLSVVPTAVATVMQVSPSQYCSESDGLQFNRAEHSSRLQNSEILGNLKSHMHHLDNSAQDDLIHLIETNLSLFSDVPSPTTVLSHDVDIGDHYPIKQHAYCVNPAKRALFQKEVEYLLENGLTVPSSSPWSSPCLLVPKADKTPRLCTDFRKVNGVTKADSYPLPRMEDCVDRVGSAKFVTKLDLLKGYWQVPLTPHASDISAFVTPDNFLQYTVMPFGLRNAPATFQRLMHIMLSGVKNCEVYLDDIVAYTSTWSEHVETLSEIFARLKKASLTLNLAKCDFGQATVTYLGKEVGQGQVRPLTAKIQAILEFPVPKTRRELRHFLGMAGYYRGFCRNFADVVVPLTSLTSVTKTFMWSPACQSAFECAKALLCSAPVLAEPDFARPFKMEVDASASGTGAVLLQEDDCGIDHRVCYFSKKFTKHQSQYSTIEKEALSLLFALQHFEVYVGSSFFLCMVCVSETSACELVFSVQVLVIESVIGGS